ncbi:MAG: carbon-nitrogen hydrolase family protein [Clostridiaceae bacterium]|nr:carbon-nitrogen hydrolase family protein [Clostridiaceae bacterium]
MIEYAKIKAAAVQAAPVYLDLDRSVEKACSLIKEAAAKGADLIGFPDSFLCGYPWWLRRVGLRHDYYARVYENAVTVPSEALAEISKCARENKIYVCIPATELEIVTLFLTQFWFDDKGNMLGKHRKLKPDPLERSVWCDGDGSTMEVFDTPIGRLGGLLSSEHLNPMELATLAAQGEQVHIASWTVAPNVRRSMESRNVVETASVFTSVSNQCYTVSSTQIITQEMLDICFDNDPNLTKLLPTSKDPAGLLGSGYANIYDMDGYPLCENLPHDQEGILIAELDLNKLKQTKMTLDTTGHYAKGRCLYITCDRTPAKAVHFIGGKSNNSISYSALQSEKGGDQQ